MLKMLLSFLISLSSAAPGYEPESQPFLIYSLIAKRCNRYLDGHMARSCKENVASLLNELNYDVVLAKSPSFVFIAFRKNVNQYLSDSKTTRYLDDLNHEMSNFMTGHTKDFNLWDFTVSKYKSPRLAAKVLAALFQDTSPNRLHINYLKSKEREHNYVFKANLELLSKTINQLNLLIDLYPNDFQSLIFPAEFKDSNLGKNFYHFYVPLYLAMVLDNQVAPLMMTLTYEFITTSGDYRYLFVDPARLDKKNQTMKLQDIYSSYCAMNMARGTLPALTLNEMSLKFNRSTYEAVEALIY